MALPALALDPDVPLKQLRHTVWQAKDGLPSDHLLAIEQTTDGYLWLATHGGLVRFDGEQFERIPLPRDPKLKSASAFSLFAPRSGGLWIGFTFGGVGLLKDGKLKMYDAQDGLPPGSIRWIVQGPDGFIWVSTSSGPARQDGSGRWQRIDTGPAPPTSIMGLFVDAGGDLWASSRTGDVFRQPAGAPSFSSVPMAPMSPGGFRDIAPASDGSTWVVDADIARRIAPSGAQRKNITRHAASAYIDNDGSLWTAHEGILFRANTRASGDTIKWDTVPDRFGIADGFAESGGIDQFFESDDGQMWFMSATSLERFSKRAVRALDTSFVPRLLAAEMGIGLQADGALFVMPAEGPLRVVSHSQVSVVPGLADVTSITRTADGSTWAGGAGTFWHQANDAWHSVPPPAGIETGDVQAIAGKSGADVWASVVRKGVYHWQTGTWRKNGDLAGLPSEPAVTLAWDAADNLWLGYADGRIARVHESTVNMFSAADGADIGVVTALIAHGNSIWAGGEFGLRHWNGRAFARLRPDHERAFDLVTGIVETASGDVWLSCALGIVRIPAADVAGANTSPSEPIVVDVFDRLDGYLGSAARVRPLPTALEGKDGTLWFVSSGGIFSIDPAASVKARAPPRALIKALVANGRRYEPNVPITLEKGTSAVQIDFVGLDLEVAERVRYRYRLDRVDKEWRDVGRQRQAFYTNLGAGQYRFHVIASSDGRIWSPHEAQLNFRIEPTFTQTSAFYGLCLLLVISGIALILRWRVRQVAQRLRWRLEAQLAERDRIARELHDTLLQSTQGLILSFQAISNRMPDGDANREKMETALERADEVLVEGRDRVRGLRRAAGGHMGLCSALRAFGEELSVDAQTTFDCKITGAEPLLAPEVADEIQRIVSEALLNAFRHSQGSLVELRIVNTAVEFSVQVDDNGVGIDPETANAGARPGHWGLRGMRERSERIGARLTIRPRTEGGTRVELSLATARPGTRK